LIGGEAARTGLLDHHFTHWLALVGIVLAVGWSSFKDGFIIII
jgi:hypothetical protein